MNNAQTLAAQPSSLRLLQHCLAIASAGQTLTARVVQTTTPRKSAAQTGGTTASTCDGALDIVPRKAMTFLRKRKPPLLTAPKVESLQQGRVEVRQLKR